MPKKRNTKVLDDIEQIPDDNYVTAEIKIAGFTFTSKGLTVLEALDRLNPTISKAKATLTVSHGDKHYSIQLIPNLVRRLANNSTYRLLLSKRFTLVLK